MAGGSRVVVGGMVAVMWMIGLVALVNCGKFVGYCRKVGEKHGTSSSSDYRHCQATSHEGTVRSSCKKIT